MTDAVLPKLKQCRDGNCLVPISPSETESKDRSYEELMLLTCHIPYLVPIRRGFCDDEAMYLLNTGKLTALSQLLTAKYLERSLIYRLLHDISQLPSTLHAYLLSMSHLHLTTNSVFYSEKEGFQFIFIPFLKKDTLDDFRSVFASIMKHVDPGDHDLRDHLALIDSALKQESCDWTALITAISAVFSDNKKSSEAATSPKLNQDSYINNHETDTAVPLSSATSASSLSSSASHNQEQKTVRHRPDLSVLLTTLFLTVLVLVVFLILHTGLLSEIPHFIQSLFSGNLAAGQTPLFSISHNTVFRL